MMLLTTEVIHNRCRQLRRRFKSRSVLALLLLGFLLVTTPLVVGLLISGSQIERVTRESESLLERAVSTSQAARSVQDRAMAFERAARQYQVLHDDEARANFNQQADALRTRVDEFRAMSPNASQLLILDQLASQEFRLTGQVLNHRQPGEWPPAVVSEFRDLDGLARDLMRQSETDATGALDRLQKLGGRARRTAIVQLVLIVPFAIALALVFTGLINRPIRRLDQGIRSLTLPETGPIAPVEGPRDLRALSLRLEWVRRKLVRTERDRLRLLGQVSHELKTPLSAIREGVNLLADQVFGKLSAKQGEVLEILNVNVQRLQEQIESLLSYNRLRSGLAASGTRSITVADLINDVLSDHALALATRRVQTSIDVEDQVEVSGHPDMLRTAVNNLVANALKFSSPQSRVGIFACTDGSRVIVEVADNGPGIRLADRERIFQPFYRGSVQSTGNIPGSGLGLAICRDLIRAHGGEVGIDQRPGWTTVFRVSLPRHMHEELNNEQAL
jgi:two-component system, NtrC family, sensor histidine kinase GlrK